MAPIYDPVHLFKIVNTAVERDCFFCVEKIDPMIHFQHLTITIPKKETIVSVHPDCFEQLQWSMLNFWVKYIKTEEKEIVH